jgi:hypothetical protein
MRLTDVETKSLEIDEALACYFGKAFNPGRLFLLGGGPSSSPASAIA